MIRIGPTGTRRGVTDGDDDEPEFRVVEPFHDSVCIWLAYRHATFGIAPPRSFQRREASGDLTPQAKGWEADRPSDVLR